MKSNNKVSIEIETIERIIKELNEISNLCYEPHLKIKIEGLQSFVSNTLNLGSKLSADDVIYKKMVQVKSTNPELHFKLYMLYRNLMSGRISEVDAMSSFEGCLSMFSQDEIAY